MPDLKQEQRETLKAFLLDKFSEEDLKKNLDLLDVKAENLWSADAIKDTKFFDIIDAAAKQEWGTLLAFNALIGHPGNDAADKLLTKDQRAGCRLFLAIDIDVIPVEVVVRLYEECKPPHWEPASAKRAHKGKRFVAYAISSCRTAGQPADPLGRFVGSLLRWLREKGSAEDAQPLLDWWSGNYLALELPSEPPAGGALDPDERYSVLIDLEETGDSDPQRPIWMPRHHLYRHSRKQFDQIAEVEQPDEVTLDTLPAYLASIRDALGFNQIDVSQVLFEFHVSKKYFACPLDQVAIPLDECITMEIGFENRVVIRDRNRTGGAQPSVAERWQKLMAEPKLIKEVNGKRAFSDSVLVPSKGGDYNELYREFAKNPRLWCMFVATAIAGQQDLSDFPCLRAAITAGVPVILWPRSPAVADQLKAGALEWFAKPARLLPDQVFELRRTCPEKQPDHLGRHVTLYFENAEYWLPTPSKYAGARK